MHAILAHAYHLAQHTLTLVTLAVALALRRLARARPALVCLGAVLAGWLLLDPHWASLHPPPVARLPVLALILLIEAALRASVKPRVEWLTSVLCAVVAAWWLRGAPVTGAAILYCVPVFVGLAVGLPVSRWLARDDDGWGGVAACLALELSLLVTGAAAHWVSAAAIPAMAGLALFGRRPATPQVAAALVMVAASTIVASDRGRLVPVDVACVVPFLTWLVAPRAYWLRFASVVACVGVSWVVERVVG